MHVRTTLPKGDFFIHITVFFNLVLLVAVVTFLCADIVPTFGFSVRMPSSEFLMESTPGRDVSIVTVTAGEEPVVFLNRKRLSKGLVSLEEELDHIIAGDNNRENRESVALIFDKAVSRAMIQKVIDMVQARNLRCFMAADPI